MRICFFTLFGVLFSCSSIIGQSFSVTPIELDDCEQIKKLGLQETYAVTINDLQKLHQCSGKRYSIVYTFTSWCKPCREFVPDIVSFYYENKSNFNLYFLIPEMEESKYQATTRKMLTDFPESIFTISDAYGNRFRKKYKNFLQELVPTFDEKNMGLGLGKVILLSEENAVVYVSSDREDKNITLFELSNLSNSITKE